MPRLASRGILFSSSLLAQGRRTRFALNRHLATLAKCLRIVRGADRTFRNDGMIRTHWATRDFHSGSQLLQ
jgi:hypothetical protein